jgi:hypothetical protein
MNWIDLDTGDAARDAAWEAQKQELLRVLDCIDAGQDPYPTNEEKK